MNRINWVDNFKAISIFLVVLGHFSMVSSTPKELIYAFHIPAFVFITGFLSLESLKNKGLLAFLRKHFLPYILFYFFISILSFFIWYYLKSSQTDFFQLAANSFDGVIYGVSGADKRFVHSNAPLWYFPFLVASLLIVYMLTRLNKLLMWVLVGFYALFSIAYVGPRAPWCLDIAGVGALFILVGGFVKSYIPKVQNKCFSRKYQLLFLFFIAVYAVLVLINGKININRSQFGDIPGLFFINAFLGIALLFFFSNLLPNLKVFKLLSEHTLVIFCFHIFFVKVINEWSYQGGGLIRTLIAFLFTIAVVTICVVISFYIKPFIDKYFFFKVSKKYQP